MAIKPIDVRRKEFKNSLRGYDANQVDDFLDTVADEFERTYSENARMREEISGLRERLQQFSDLEGSIRAALVHAEQAASDVRDSANREAETVREIHRLGGVAVVPHPLSYLTFSCGERALRELAALGDDSAVDGIELRNPSYAGRVRATRAAWLNAHVLRVAETGSSDAHHAALVGTAWTEFPGTTPADLRAAILARATVARGRRWTLREHLDGAVRQQWRSMLRDPAKRVWKSYVRGAARPPGAQTEAPQRRGRASLRARGPLPPGPERGVPPSEG